MTHLFDYSANSLNLIKSGEQTFDILKFEKTVSIGDTLIFQKIDEREEEYKDKPFDEEEFVAKITFILPTNGELKKGYVAVGFKEKE